MIKLSENDKVIIAICKMHFTREYPNRGGWLKTFEKVWEDQYLWSPNEDGNYQDYVNGLFFRLYEIYNQIKLDHSGSNLQMRNLFSSIFYKSPSRDVDSPIERGILELCGLIQSNRVVENGSNRYELFNSKIYEVTIKIQDNSPEYLSVFEIELKNLSDTQTVLDYVSKNVNSLISQESYPSFSEDLKRWENKIFGKIEIQNIELVELKNI